jgi:hypothetical protein
MTGQSSLDEIYWSLDNCRSFYLYTKDIREISGLEFDLRQKLIVLTSFRGLFRSKNSTSSETILVGNVYKEDIKDCLKTGNERPISIMAFPAEGLMGQ